MREGRGAGAPAAGGVPSPLARITAALHRILGAPDYARYLRHVRERHPGMQPLSPREFERERQRARYERPGSRCC